MNNGKRPEINDQRDSEEEHMCDLQSQQYKKRLELIGTKANTSSEGLRLINKDGD